MLTKARTKGVKPPWIGEEAWYGLLLYWASEEFKKLSTQNKANRAETRGGAVHTSHLEERELGRAVDPNELFVVPTQRGAVLGLMGTLGKHILSRAFEGGSDANW